jgi:acetyl-CoA synthetase
MFKFFLLISGHRIGTAEIEDVLDEHKCVAESAVIGFPHDLTGRLCILS